MISEHVDQGTVRAALALAQRAPSVHNTQPWTWRLGPHSVHLYADLRRWLPATDPDGRDLVLSCGAALHHLRVALAASGVGTTVRRLPNPDEPDHLAAVELDHGAPTAIDYGLVRALGARRTDRRPFTTWPVPEAVLRELIDEAAAQGAVLRVVAGAAARRHLLAAIDAAAHAQDATEGYRTELALWSGRVTGTDGVPAANAVLPGPRVGASIRAFAGAPAVTPGGHGDGDVDGALLLAIGTASDDALSQLRAGEAMSAVLLHATAHGLASSPLSQPLEVDRTRAVLRDDVLGGTLSPQLVLRIGWAPTATAPPPLTPRRPVDQAVAHDPR